MEKMLRCKKGLRPTIFLSKNRRGLSTVVTTLIIVSVSMAAVVLIWGVINNMIKGEIKSSESCFGNYDKVKINGQYTCYVIEGVNDYSLRFSIMVGDIKLEKVVVAVGSEGTIKSYSITNSSQIIEGLSEYPSGLTSIIMPEKNAGKTYLATGFPGMIDSIQLAPVIGGTQCEISDAVYQIEQCEIE